MEIHATKATGKLKVSEDVLEKIASISVKEIDGVYDFAPGNATFKEVLLKSNAKKPIKINLNGGVAQIDVSVILKFGYQIKTVSEKIQNAVKDTVQNMTGVTVSKVNIFVAGVHLNEASAE